MVRQWIHPSAKETDYSFRQGWKFPGFSIIQITNQTCMFQRQHILGGNNYKVFLFYT